MIFIIDAQVFQTNTWHRGMGKYSIELLRGLSRSGSINGYEFEFVINSNLTLNRDRKEALINLFPNARFRNVDLKLSNAHNVQKVQKNNKKKLDEIYSDKDSIFFIPSLFENEVAPVFPENCKKLILVYDLIPLFFYDRYMGHSEPVRNNYFGRFTVLFEADHILTISETTKNDFARSLGIPLSKITNIDGARIPIKGIDIQPKYISKKKFILSPSGDDLRKNNRRMIEAFDDFNRNNGNVYELFITSNFSKKSIDDLKVLSDSVHFVGNVPENELHWYYKHAEAVFFIPEYEGLGLPVLEAVEADKKIICSDISVFREIVPEGDSIYLCNPQDNMSIYSGLETILNGKRNIDKKQFTEIKKKYSWERTAQLFIELCKNLKTKKQTTKKRIAVVGPMPGGKSAIGKVIECTHSELSNLADITYFFEIPKEDIKVIKHSFLEYCSDWKSISKFNKHTAQAFDGIIYHLGNSTYHLKSIIESLAIPGVTVLHDTRFEGVFNCLLAEGYISQPRLAAERAQDLLLGTGNSSDHISSLINASSGIITHSDYAQTAARKCLIYDKSIEKAGLALGMSEQLKRIPNKRIVVAVAGIISQTKGLDLLRELLESAELTHLDFKLFGYDYAIDQVILDQLSSYNNLIIKRNLSDLNFREELESADILLNYRNEYKGETSYAVLEAMRAGVVPVVRSIGWYSELPLSCAVKIENISDIFGALKRLSGDPNKLSTMAYNCYEYVANNHSSTGYSKKLYEAI